MKRIKYKVTLPHPIINFNVKKHVVVRDGPLENLLGGGGGRAGEVQNWKFAQGIKWKKIKGLNEKKFLHAN